MKRSKRPLVSILSCLCMGTLMLTSCSKKQDDHHDDTPDSTTLSTSSFVTLQGMDGNCQAPEAWFDGPVPEPRPDLFPDDPTNCDFHLISWQYFLWLTEEVDGQLRFQTMFSNDAITPETKNDTSHPLDIVEQALSKGILVDLDGRAVYSSIIINDVYRDWVINNKLYEPDVLHGFDANANFPVGSMSLKTAWKVVQPDDDTTHLYTTKADIELLTMVNGQPRIPENPKVQKDVTVALVGLHIAVVVKGHPEFIWATFEFDGNAPNFKPNQGMNDAVSDKDWLFYKAGTPARNTNANNAGILKFVDQQKQILSPPTQVARQYKDGGGSTKNQTNIDTLNNSVRRQLPANTLWTHYFEVGAEWFNTEKGTLHPDWSPNVDSTMVTGSIVLSNSTIETFTQKIRSQNQCFSCHNSMAVTNVPEPVEILPGKNVNTSHILLKRYQGGGQVNRSN